MSIYPRRRPPHRHRRSPPVLHPPPPLPWIPFQTPSRAGQGNLTPRGSSRGLGRRHPPRRRRHAHHGARHVDPPRGAPRAVVSCRATVSASMCIVSAPGLLHRLRVNSISPESILCLYPRHINFLYIIVSKYKTLSFICLRARSLISSLLTFRDESTLCLLSLSRFQRSHGDRRVYYHTKQ